VLVSDGIIDARNAADERFGEPRVLELIEHHRGEPPTAIVNEVFTAVSRHAPYAADDRTLLVLYG
jgi:serine phosphatase RsbU (regulator of sigma subunit)